MKINTFVSIAAFVLLNCCQFIHWTALYALQTLSRFLQRKNLGVCSTDPLKSTVVLNLTAFLFGAIAEGGHCHQLWKGGSLPRGLLKNSSYCLIMEDFFNRPLVCHLIDDEIVSLWLVFVV